MALSKSEREFHRRIAAKCFNEAWDCLEKNARSVHDEEIMLNLAHASRFHWGLVGTATNQAVSDWQISRVYAKLREPRLALEFAKSCLAKCKKERLSEIVHTAYEAVARAYAIDKKYPLAKSYVIRARKQLDRLKLDKDDKRVYLDQIAETERLIEK